MGVLHVILMLFGLVALALSGAGAIGKLLPGKEHGSSGPQGSDGSLVRGFNEENNVSLASDVPSSVLSDGQKLVDKSGSKVSDFSVSDKNNVFERLLGQNEQDGIDKSNLHKHTNFNKLNDKIYKNDMLLQGPSGYLQRSEANHMPDIANSVGLSGKAIESQSEMVSLHPVTQTKSKTYHSLGIVEPVDSNEYEKKVNNVGDVDDSNKASVLTHEEVKVGGASPDATDKQSQRDITSTNMAAYLGLINKGSSENGDTSDTGHLKPSYNIDINPPNSNKIKDGGMDLIQTEMKAPRSRQREKWSLGESRLRQKRETSPKYSGSQGNSYEDMGDTLNEDYNVASSNGGGDGQNRNSPNMRKEHGANRIRHSGHFDTSHFHSPRNPQMTHAVPLELPVLQRSTRAHSDTDMEPSLNNFTSVAKNGSLDNSKPLPDKSQNPNPDSEVIPQVVPQPEEDNNGSKPQNLTDSKIMYRSSMFVDYRASAVVDHRPGAGGHTKMGVGELSVNPNKKDEPFHVAGVSDDPVSEPDKTVKVPGIEGVAVEENGEEETEEDEEEEEEPEPEAEEAVPDDSQPEPTPSGEKEILVWPDADPDYTDPVPNAEQGEAENADLEPKSSPIFDLKGKPEPEEEIDPSSEHFSGKETLPYAEPEPDWPEAKKVWGPAWELHVYGIGIANAVLAVYSFVSIIRLWRKKNLLSQHYFIILNLIMFIMGFTRALFFLVDGYNSMGRFTTAGAYFLYTLSFPCLTSAFSILLLALLQTTRMQLISPKIQKVKILVGIIGFHFSFSILTDIIVGYIVSAEAMMLVCQMFTVVWGFCLFGGYIYLFRQMYMSARRRQKEMLRLTLSRMKLNGTGHSTKPPKLTLNLAVKVTLLSAVLGLILAIWQIYGMVGVFGVLSEKTPDPWAWWWFKFGMRIVELALCITMSYVGTQPFRYQGVDIEKQCRWMNVCFMAPCQRLFECNTSIHDEDLHWNDMHEMGPGLSQENMISNGGQAFTDPEETYPINGSVVPSPYSTPNGLLNGQRGTGSRPTSLLVSDSGFVRFRQDGEMEGSPVLLSTDDEPEGSDPSGYINPFAEQTQGAVGPKELVLPGTFGESTTDSDEMYFHYYPRYTTLPHHIRRYPISGPNTGSNTPATPRSFVSNELDNFAGSMFSFRPPSSIHLRDSIDNVLNVHGFSIRTPDNLDSPTNAPIHYLSRGSRAPSLRRNRIHSSMGDLESIVSARSRNTCKQGQGVGHESLRSVDSATTDSNSCYEDALSDTGTFRWERPYLFRSHSDCTGSILASWDRHLDDREDRTNLQDLLLDINRMCVALGQFAQNREESAEEDENEGVVKL